MAAKPPEIWWNGGIIDIAAIVFYSLTMYPRCFYSTSSFFLSLNDFTFLTKFAFISQEHFLYMQLTNILLTILCRTLSVCFTSTKIARVFNSLSCWCFLLIQFGIPTLIVIPLYVIANAKYGVKGLSVPLLLSSQDNKYNEYTFIIWVVYGFTVLFTSMFGYGYILYIVKKKSVNRSQDAKILTHCACLILALLAVLGSLSVRRFRVLEGNPFMKLFFFTSILWIPFTNLVVTLYATTALRSVLVRPFVRRKSEQGSMGNLMTVLQ
ncbi:hypothetical protein Y032_0006g2828 [Ancylostoma ceylanicum]|uniref:Serpentine receptor class gamma n=1 Tax=Ancylostoma ceylanicum TaxID=53326 RepID=A0A016VNM1_9BILA|nr:hypothetical protein Y032_0006g2828 [Ancylostoma ceylanicum]